MDTFVFIDSEVIFTEIFPRIQLFAHRRFYSRKALLIRAVIIFRTVKRIIWICCAESARDKRFDFIGVFQSYIIIRITVCLEVDVHILKLFIKQLGAQEALISVFIVIYNQPAADANLDYVVMGIKILFQKCIMDFCLSNLYKPFIRQNSVTAENPRRRRPFAKTYITSKLFRLRF